MACGLSVVAYPNVLAVALEDAKSHLIIDDNEHDAILEKVIFAAMADASIESGVGVGTGSYALKLDRFPTNRIGRPLPIELPLRPATVVQVAYISEAHVPTVLDASKYAFGSTVGCIESTEGSWPATAVHPEAVTVSFNAGFAPNALPPQIWQAVLLIAADRWEHRGDGADRKPIPDAARRLLFQVNQRVF